ncbi:MAG: tRNA (5-methylaminomethyl-2-thiouridine)(34)-methyltransferase MnmD [Flavobacteriaceae bacterium]|nr:tRNA (5-methylaminomethyl-2-thiouridine)(34)-methyltransferase MnmD [Flavobacteriaceae bacterium]
MERKIITTLDGSTTIHLPEWDEQYHSKNGAIQEAYHVFIEMGFFYFLNKFQPKEVNILEIGFGTGLNAFITLLETQKRNVSTFYTGIEAYPVEGSEIKQLNYHQQLKVAEEDFLILHSSPWGKTLKQNSNFKLLKRKMFFSEINDTNQYDIIYFDAFGARVQPELWTEEIFQRMYDALKVNGVLVTYSAKGSVRRAMQAVGFKVERLPGPPGKREMLRATKVD